MGRMVTHLQIRYGVSGRLGRNIDHAILTGEDSLMEYGHRSAHVRRLVGVGVLTAFLATAFAPAMAAAQSPPDRSAFSSKSIEKAVTNTNPEASVRSEKSPSDAPKQATRSASFFKTRTGVLVLIAMAVGTGYAVHSTREDRIKGINR
jgi:hypothetical protein